MVKDEDLLLALLNSAPVIDGKPTDMLTGATGEEFIVRFGGTGSADERTQILQMRQYLQEAVLGRDDALTHLALALDDAVLIPQITPGGIRWQLQTRPDSRLSTRAAIAWSRVLKGTPGRLRPCANTECNLFLLDRSRPGTAKWCSMATCGNRMKSRRLRAAKTVLSGRPDPIVRTTRAQPPKNLLSLPIV